MGRMQRDRNDWVETLQRRMAEFVKLMVAMEGGEGGRHDGNEALPADVFENADNLVVEVDIPGVNPADVRVRVYGNILGIDGLKREERAGEDSRFVCMERKFGRFRRVFELPPTADLAGMRAVYRKGVLRVTIPLLAEGALIREIPVEQEK